MRGAEVIGSKGCSRLFAEISISNPSFRGGHEFESFAMESMSRVSTASRVDELACKNKSKGPFSGLVICVTGLSKEARKQVMAATERLGGEYSPHLHPQCTHLVVQSLHGRKFEHALKHGAKNGLSVVTLGWFVDSVRRNVRLSESLYSIKTGGECGVAADDLSRLFYSPGAEKSCLPYSLLEYSEKCDTIEGLRIHFPEGEFKRRSMNLLLSGYSFYIDADVSADLQVKVVEAARLEGATFLDQWYVGSGANYVVCEGPSVRKYLGHANNIVTPLWVLKTAREKCLQRLVHISADLARQTAITIDVIQTGTSKEEDCQAIGYQGAASSLLASCEERHKIANQAKDWVRRRRNYRMQTCQSPIRPISPNSLLDSVCWSISEPTSSATIYTEFLSMEDANFQDTSVFFDAKSDGNDSEASFVNLSRPLTESEKSELILKNHFLTILFPVDRFSEMGPCSRTFFSDKGFTCLQVLDYIYEFYQENMAAAEIEVAIHTDSRHADRLRSIFSSKETAGYGHLAFKRIDFLGSRKSFEMLKHVAGDNKSNVYELLIRA